jgi:acetone carboxylase gamma subunit
VSHKLKEWKERWNNGEVKFVPEMFEEFERLLETQKIINKCWQQQRETNYCPGCGELRYRCICYIPNQDIKI